MLKKLLICIFVVSLGANLLIANNLQLGEREILLEPSSKPAIVRTLNGDPLNPFGRWLDTLYYDNGTAYWGTQGASNALFWAVRFTPEDLCTLLAGIFKIWVYTGVAPICTLFAWDDNMGTPGSLADGPLVIQTVDRVWNRGDFTGGHWDLDDFWVGYWLPWYDPDTTLAFMDNPLNYPTRQALGVRTGPSTWNWTVSPGIPGDLMIRAIVTYGQGVTDLDVTPDTLRFSIAPADTDTLEIMVISNAGQEWIFVDSIIPADSWFTYINPTTFSIGAGKSVNVYIIVTRDGLPNGTHYSSLAIHSNDPDENPYIEPVEFTLEVIGVEETESPGKKPTYCVNIFPNPMITKGKFVYSLPAKTDVEISIYDIAGRLVRRLFKGSEKEGIHTVLWDRRDTNGVKVTQGVYIYNFIASEFRSTGNIVVIR